MSLFGNKNEVSDTQRELEEYMKKRSQDNSGMNFNGYYSPDRREKVKAGKICFSCRQ